MAEKLTPAGLVVGLIPEEDLSEQETPVQEPAAPEVEQPEPRPKRSRKAKA